MKLLKKDLKKNYIYLEINNPDDLWHLYHIVSKGDKIKGKTERKIKIGEDNDRNKKVIRKTYILEIELEKIELQKDQLRLSGKITEGPEDIPKGLYHSISLFVGDKFSIIKQKFFSFQLQKIEDACREKQIKILICAFDRSEASFALLKTYGYDYLGDISGNVQKKQMQENIKGDFFLEIIQKIKYYNDRYKLEKIILGSPAFWKDELMKKIPSDLRSKITLATCNNTGKNGINEILKRDEIKQVLKQDRVHLEISLVDKLLQEISKNNLATYGFKDIELAVQSGAIKNLLITDNFLKQSKENKTFERLDLVMQTIENQQGEIHLISSKHEGGKKLDGLSGIGAILRFKIS